MFTFLTHFTPGTLESTIALSLSIVLCAVLLEDVTTVVVGVLAADGFLPVPLALLSLLVGIALGDTALYGLGAFARTHPRLAHYIEHDFTAPFRSWLEKSYAFKIFSGHFVPGLRFTTYVASGFFHFPLKTYIPMALSSGLVLGTTLFVVSFWFGSLTTKWVGEVRWSIAGVFLLILFLIARHSVVTYRQAKRESDIGDDIHTP